MDEKGSGQVKTPTFPSISPTGNAVSTAQGSLPLAIPGLKVRPDTPLLVEEKLEQGSNRVQHAHFSHTVEIV